jgi:hypothetical protein
MQRFLACFVRLTNRGLFRSGEYCHHTNARDMLVVHEVMDLYIATCTAGAAVIKAKLPTAALSTYAAPSPCRNGTVTPHHLS